jgi:hypothetical protein
VRGAPKNVRYCARRIAALDLRQADGEACGLVENAARRPQRPQDEQRQQPLASQ